MRFKDKVICAVGPHPDDIESGCFGTLHRFKDECKVVTYVASLGSQGDPSSTPLRAEESRKALSELSPAAMHVRHKVGIKEVDYQEISSELEALFQEHDVDAIICPGRDDTHQEHRMLFDIVLTASRRQRADILIYGTFSNTPRFSPSIFVDISEQLDAKLRALACHKTQQGKFYMQEDYLQTFHFHKFAALHSLTVSESFELFRAFV